MRTTRFLALLILLAAPGFPLPAHAEDSDTAARRGTRLYEEGRYEEAAEAFRLARELARREGEPPPALDYNLGTAYARQGEFDRAVETLKEAASVPEPEDAPSIRERAWYNLGVSSALKAEELRRQGETQLQAEYETLKQALDAFRQSLILDSEDENARHNYALTQQRLREIESLMQQQQQQDQQQQHGGESSDQQGEQGQDQEQQPSQEGQSGENEGADESDRGDSQQSRVPHPSETSEENPENSAPSEAGDERPSQPEQQASPENGEEQTREKRGADPSRDREEEQPASSDQQHQQGGLEATPTPTPGAAQSSPNPRPGERDEEVSDRSNRPSANAGGARGKQEPTPEQLDALRVLNSLEEGEPEQFKKLFRFRGGEGRNLERDW